VGQSMRKPCSADLTCHNCLQHYELLLACCVGKLEAGSAADKENNYDPGNRQMLSSWLILPAELFRRSQIDATIVLEDRHQTGATPNPRCSINA